MCAFIINNESSLHASERGYLKCINVLSAACMSLQCSWRPEKGIRYPGTGIIDHGEVPCEC